MKTNEMFQEIAKDLSAMGIKPIANFDMSLEEITNIGIQALYDLDLKDIEHLIERISSYNIFLKSRRGSLEAQLAIMEAELSRNLYSETQLLAPRRGDSWLTKEEKEAMVLRNNEKIKSLKDKVLIIKAEFLKLKDLPFAIDKKIDVLKMMYMRRVNESRSRD